MVFFFSYLRKLSFVIVLNFQGHVGSVLFINVNYKIGPLNHDPPLDAPNFQHTFADLVRHSS